MSAAAAISEEAAGKRRQSVAVLMGQLSNPQDRRRASVAIASGMSLMITEPGADAPAPLLTGRRAVLRSPRAMDALAAITDAVSDAPTGAAAPHALEVPAAAAAAAAAAPSSPGARSASPVAARPQVPSSPVAQPPAAAATLPPAQPLVVDTHTPSNQASVLGIVVTTATVAGLIGWFFGRS